MGTGQRIGEFEVVAELGKGGMGVVYEVRHPAHAGRLALKVIHSHAADADALQRFGREAELMARVKHPGIVTIHSLGNAPQGPYMVMELIEGEDLKDRSARGPMEPEEAARIVRALADAIQALHERQIIHRDLKPANVLLEAGSGRPVILDFGIARGMDLDRLTQTGALVGSPAYMSPEQANGMSPTQVDGRTDVYGLGTILFTLLAGQAPFAESGGMVSTLKKVLVDDPPWPKGPAPLLSVLRKAMAKERDDRYASAAAFRDELDHFLAGEDVDGAPALRRVPWPLLVVSAGVLALLAVLGLLTLRGGDPEPSQPVTEVSEDLPPVESFEPRPVEVFARASRRPLIGQFGRRGQVVLWSRGDRSIRFWTPSSGAVRRNPVSRPLRAVRIATYGTRTEAVCVLDKSAAAQKVEFLRVEDLERWDGTNGARSEARHSCVLPLPGGRTLQPSRLVDRLRVRHQDVSLVESLRLSEPETEERTSPKTPADLFDYDDEFEGSGGVTPRRLDFVRGRIVALARRRRGSHWLAVWAQAGRGSFGGSTEYKNHKKVSTEPRHKVPLPGPGVAVALAPDGRSAVVGLADGWVQVLDVVRRKDPVACGRLEGVLDVGFLRQDVVAALGPTSLSAWSTDGKPLGSLTWPKGQQGLRALEVGEGGGVLISAEGRVERHQVEDLLRAMLQPEAAVRLFAARRVRFGHWRIDPAGPSSSLGARRVGSRLITWSFAHTPAHSLRVWDLEREVPVIGASLGPVHSIAPYDDGSLAVVLPQGVEALPSGARRSRGVEVRVLSYDQLAPRWPPAKTEEPGEYGRVVERLPDGRLALGGEIFRPGVANAVGGRLYVFDPRAEPTGPLEALQGLGGMAIQDLVVRGDRLVVSSGQEADLADSQADRGFVRLFDVSGEPKQLRVEGQLVWVHEVDLEPGGETLWTANSEHKVVRYRRGGPDGGEEPLRSEEQNGPMFLKQGAVLGSSPRSLRFLDDGRLLLAGQGDLQLWDVSGEPRRLLYLTGFSETFESEGREADRGLAGAEAAGDLLMLSYEGFQRDAWVELWPRALLDGRTSGPQPFREFVASFRQKPDPSGD